MTVQQSRLHAIYRLHCSLLLAGLVVASAGCSRYKDVQWTEEVRLSNGQIVIAEREDRYRRVMDAGAGFQVGWLYERGSVRTSLPAPIGQTVQWEGTLRPILLDVIGGNTVYFVAVPGSGAAREEWNLPRDEKYIVMVLDGKNWKRISLEQLPIEAKPNLMANTRIFFEESDGVRLRPSRKIDLSTKTKVDSDPRIVKHLTSIVRPPTIHE